MSGRIGRWSAQPWLWWLVLYLAATSRWGSYVGVPGVPVFISDLVLAVAAIGVATQVARSSSSPRQVLQHVAAAPVALHLCLVLLAWSLLRAVLGISSFVDAPLTALRDLAPYGYAIAAPVGYLLAVQGSALARRLLYGALAFHAAWILLGTRLPGWPWGVVLGGTTPVFSPRPDVDSALAGIAIGLALHDVLLRGERRSPRRLAVFAAFALVNGAVILTLQTRAGLLASIVAVGAVLTAWAWRSRGTAPVSRRNRLAVSAAALAVLALVIALSPPGQRLVQAMRGQQSQALGTVQVRENAWRGLLEYITADAARTAVGVGFGPDFIEDSGRAYLLEGTEYKDVRSPHNYVLGTLARLGVFGAVLVLMTVLAGWLLAARLVAARDAPTVFAALVVLSFPVTALLGVVLESPFGAIPYFWAIGQLAHAYVQHREGSKRGATARQEGSRATLSSYQR